ncbi:AAA family ATPase [Mycobacterium paraterrae]|uniref:AAA family ATPase n=2 Tax=Mycobacterium paraterrae TaxID=577492 RepID=A0ABY3VSV3_9MYCO|nr:BTAD domain-containing putative transcriptional regulator [Mycobacterium paraterrae]UMB72220.1 AAA family ATPase [Mycobacterium paraterrae]
MLGLSGGSVVSAETLLELLWGDDPPRTAAKALQTHISALRRALGDGFVRTQGSGWVLNPPATDASRYKQLTKTGRDAVGAGDITQAVACFEEALALWRGTPELPDNRRGIAEKTRWIESHAALVEDRADALLATGRAAEIIGELEAAVADAPLRERRWGQLMLALYRAGRQGEALAAYRRARSLLADELGVDPGTELRRLEAAIVAQDNALDAPVLQQASSVMRAVTFMLTDIEGSTAAWEADSGAMAVALARHDELVEQIVTSRGGRLIKTRGEGDATFSVFDRPSGAAAAAMELQDAMSQEPWSLREPMRVRVALHTGEAELRDGDYFGRAVNRAARLRSLADGGQILCSGATAELVIDTLPDNVVLADLGMRHLKNLARPEHVFELRVEADDGRSQPPTAEEPFERPALPAVLTGPGPFVGRVEELARLSFGWQAALSGGTRSVLIAGEPGVGKTRLGGEWSQQAYGQGAIVLYGRCDEDLGAPYQPFAEALRSLVPCIGSQRLRALRGVEALLALVPGLTDVLPDLAAPTRSDPDTERYALFDAVVAVMEAASAGAPVVLILDDLHWAAKPTLLLLRHVLRFGEHARVQIVGTYRSTDLDRSHPLAAMLADLHRDGTAERINLAGLDGQDVTAYVAEAGYGDEDLAAALASVTGGNPFFLIEALRHVEESGGKWDQSTLPQGVREAVSRRLSRLPEATNKALAAAAVVGSRFPVDLVEQVVEQDLVDAFEDASKAGIIIEEPGGRYRFNHAIVRQSLLAELASVRRMRLHQRIAATLEAQPGYDDERLAELAHHYFECAWAGNASKAVEYCRRAADQAMARLAYEGAADLYDRALHAMEEIDDELPDREDQAAQLLVARCEASLAAGDVTSAKGAIAQLRSATVDSTRLAAWATCFEGQLSMLTDPERLDEVEAALRTAAQELAGLGDAAGEATAHTVRAGCLARLGRVGDCEIALDEALTAARRAGEHRRVNGVLANAPLAALWGPNPVPRAGGRCLDVVRLLRITTDSPAVEATSTRCQAVLEAFRGRAAAARRMIDAARRTVTDLGLRHALMEVEQFAGIVELVVGEPAEAEPHLRKAYNGFRRMGLDADTAETAALLGRACLNVGRTDEADELCSESEKLAGHALKPSIAWRVLRAHLLSRSGSHDEARRIAEAAVSLAERTDALVDHGDACFSLALVLDAAGDAARARAVAEQAAELYERKGAVALAERARSVLGAPVPPAAPVVSEVPPIKPDNEAVRVGERVMDAIHRSAWDEVDRLFAPDVTVESRRKVVGLTVRSDTALHHLRHEIDSGTVQVTHVMVAARGDRLALSRLTTSFADDSPGAPRDELLQVYMIDETGRVARQIWFDVEDLDAAMAELDALHVRLERETGRQASSVGNRATAVFERFWSCSAAGDWDAVAQLIADEFHGTDHRRVVNGGNQKGRELVIESMRISGDIGFTLTMTRVMAIRGERLALTRVRASGRDSDAIQDEALNIVEIDADGKIISIAVFDLDDFDTAVAELDARYMAGEAAVYADTWSPIARSYAAMCRGGQPPITPDAVTIDHRRATAYGPSKLRAFIETMRETRQEIRPFVESVHRLNERGAVVSYAARGNSAQGFEAEWQGINVAMVDGDVVCHIEFFDETDLDAAIATFDRLCGLSRRLENIASRVAERFWECFTSRDWASMATLLDEEVAVDDRRPATNAGLRFGRDAEIEDSKAAAKVGFTTLTPNVVATRGERLVLSRTQATGQDPDAIRIDVLHLIETDTAGHITALVVFEVDDFASAIEELDARYLAGEAASHAHAWSMIAESYAALARQEFSAISPQAAFVDHRRGTSFGPTSFKAVVHVGWDLGQDIRPYIEAVHRLTDIGGVCAFSAHGTSDQGFDAEWRGLSLTTIDGDVFDRCEFFDEVDLDKALRRFDELDRPPTRLANAATRAFDHMWASFAVRDWAAIAEVVADDEIVEDRRRVVNAGVRQGRDAGIEELRTAAELGFTITMESVIAVRGDRLALIRVRAAGRDPEAIQNDAANLVELDADGKIGHVVVFDFEDFDAAIAELDARYTTGEAAAYSHTWSVIANTLTAHNRREIAPSTSDVVSIDHRRAAAFGPGEGPDYLRAGWELGQTLDLYVENVHRINRLGAVFTWAGNGSSHDGFDAERRGTTLMEVDGDLVSRIEVFDDLDVDVALARFDETCCPTKRLQNAASRVWERFEVSYPARDWPAIADLLADSVYTDDRRRPINSGVRRGPDALIAEMVALADVGIDVTSEVVATRGERLALSRLRTAGHDQGPEGFGSLDLDVLEVGPDGRGIARVVFNLDDFDSAITELDARYLAGEAAPYATTWSVISASYAAINRQQLPPITQDWINVDHRREVAMGTDDLFTYISAETVPNPNNRTYVEAVHRLGGHGALVTYAAKEVSREGFDAEWRGVAIIAVEGELVSRIELFDEADVDRAVARFDELARPTHLLANAATRATERLRACFTTHDWSGLTDVLAEDLVADDRRRVVGLGIRRGREANLADIRVGADIGTEDITSTVIATRGDRLSLDRARFCMNDQHLDALSTELLSLVGVDDSGRMSVCLMLDSDDLDGAIAELDAQYLAGEAAPYSKVWLTLMRGYAALNRHEMPPLTPDALNVDHRRARGFAPGDLAVWLDASWDLMPDASMYVATVHRLSEAGAVVTQVVRGTTHDGFDAEWRELVMLTSAGDRMSGVELFDEEDFDTALARFEGLTRRQSGPQNLATQISERFADHFAQRDWDGMENLLAENLLSEDRRSVVNAGVRRGRDADMANWRATADLWATVDWSTVAIRGERLALLRFVFTNDESREAFAATALAVVEVNGDSRIEQTVIFEPDKLEAAIEELDRRYLAGEAAAHFRTWSVIAQAYAALNRNELPAVSSDFVDIDHRSLTSINSGDLMAYLRVGIDDAPRTNLYVEAVHRLTDAGAITTHVANGTTPGGFDAEWRITNVITVRDRLINRCEMFDEADLDAALATFDAIDTSKCLGPANTASHVEQRFMNHFGTRDWDAIAGMIANDFCMHDRRRTVSSGVSRGREGEIAALKAIADVGVTGMTPTVIAVRGERLALADYFVSDRWGGTHALSVVEIDEEDRIAARVGFDLEDFDAAIAELDARYAAGEAADHVYMWSLIVDMHAAVNRRELPSTTENHVYIDHRPLVSVEGVDLAASLRALWGVSSKSSVYVEAVHRLDDSAAVVSQMVKATTREGLDTELRIIEVVTVDAGRLSRIEVFDETHLNAALTKFDELVSQTKGPENVASQIYERFLERFAARDWEAVARTLRNDIANDDRRRVVSAGVLHGRDATVASMRAAADLGVSAIATTVVATRGDRLLLGRDHFSVGDPSESNFAEVLGIIEVDADDRIVARVSFDVNDFDAAIEELDARYLAGEAAVHAQTWATARRIRSAYNRHDVLPTTPDWVNIDHRRGRAFAAGEATSYVRATYDVAPDVRGHVEAVHRLSDVGMVVTSVLVGTSSAGFSFEWREVALFVFEGDLIRRFEVFDEADLNAALARFDELSRTVQPENDAVHLIERLRAAFATRDWTAAAELLSDEIYTDDRRRLVNAGLRHGRDAEIDSLRAAAEVGSATIDSAILATRGERLALGNFRFSAQDRQSPAFHAEMLGVIEVDSATRAAAIVVFDPDDIAAAIEELDARYLAGEAAAHAHTWSVIAEFQAAVSRREVPETTSHPGYIDHRLVAGVDGVDLRAAIRGALDVTSNFVAYAEVVHRLDDRGAVYTQTMKGASLDGFDFEWRMIELQIVDGDLLSRVEVFDEADLDAALARFDELIRTPLPENDAIRAWARLIDAFNRRDIENYVAVSNSEMRYEDRRRGMRDEFEGRVEQRRAVLAMFNATPTSIKMTSQPMATRGSRLALMRVVYFDTAHADRPTTVEMLQIAEVDDRGLLCYSVSFDPSEIDAAFDELDARYLAGEAAAYADTWSTIMWTTAAFNRHDIPAMSTDLKSFDHRRGIAFAPGEIIPYMQATLDVASDIKLHVETVHRLTELGVVVTHVAYGTSGEGFSAEWRENALLTVKDNLVNRFEMFDETDVDVAVARLEELRKG